MRQVILIPDETGGYVVEVPSLPGCYSQGETEDEALTNIKEAIDLYIESMMDQGEPVPEDFPPIQIMSVSLQKCLYTNALEHSLNPRSKHENPSNPLTNTTTDPLCPAPLAV